MTETFVRPTENPRWTRRRRVLGAIAAVWLCCRLAALGGPLIAGWSNTVEAGATECHCTHGADASCPMHHAPARGVRMCAMQAADDWATAAVASMLGPVAPIAAGFALDQTRAVDSVCTRADSLTPRLSIPPDLPPPRS